MPLWSWPKIGKIAYSLTVRKKILFTFHLFFIANFHVLGLFVPKKRVESEKKISVCHVALPELPAVFE
jgi:hypothetical protein